MDDNSYPNIRRVVYGEDKATFVPVCPDCGWFVKADKTILVNGDGIKRGPNATCSGCGRVAMLFEGFI